jgi:hypothetical protein
VGEPICLCHFCTKSNKAKEICTVDDSSFYMDSAPIWTRIVGPPCPYFFPESPLDSRNELTGTDTIVNNWIAIRNTVKAIANVYCHLTDAEGEIRTAIFSLDDYTDQYKDYDFPSDLEGEVAPLLDKLEVKVMFLSRNGLLEILEQLQYSLYDGGKLFAIQELSDAINQSIEPEWELL